jgi:hypothetical protein
VSVPSWRYAGLRGSGCDSRIEGKQREKTSRLTAVSAKKPKRKPPRNAKLRIELPFEEALRAALETEPPARGFSDPVRKAQPGKGQSRPAKRPRPPGS